jgi:cobalt-zinc-cadmium efflux system outer membrane protein
MQRAVVSMLLLGGCATTSPEKARGEAQDLVSERLDQRVSWAAATAADDAVEKRVRGLLARELTADAAVQIALVRNPDLLVTLEDLGIAQADLVEAGLLRNVHFGGGPRFPLRGGNDVGWSFDVAGSFIDAMLIPLRKKAARAHLRASTLRVATRVIELDTRVRQAFFAAAAAERLLELRRAQAELASAAAELAARQVQAGVHGTMNELELGQLRAADADARIALQEAGVEAVETREHLVRLLGLWGSDVDFELPDALPLLPRKDPALQDLEQIAVRQRLDLQAQRAQVDALVSAVKIARRVPFVDVSVGALGEADPGDGPTLGPFLELEIPVFNWGQAEIARAEARLRQVEQRLLGTAIDARSEVRVARTRVVAQRQLAEYERDVVLPLHMGLVALGQERYDAMLLGVYELIELKQHELEARAEFVRHLRDYWSARADLELAIGGRLESSLARYHQRRAPTASKE